MCLITEFQVMTDKGLSSVNGLCFTFPNHSVFFDFPNKPEVKEENQNKKKVHLVCIPNTQHFSQESALSAGRKTAPQNAEFDILSLPDTWVLKRFILMYSL